MLRVQGVLLGLIVLAIGTSTLWLKHEPLLALAVVAAGMVLYAAMPPIARRIAGNQGKT
jgi:hypothetical protein